MRAMKKKSSKSNGRSQRRFDVFFTREFKEHLHLIKMQQESSRLVRKHYFKKASLEDYAVFFDVHDYTLRELCEHGSYCTDEATRIRNIFILEELQEEFLMMKKIANLSSHMDPGVCFNMLGDVMKKINEILKKNNY